MDVRNTYACIFVFVLSCSGALWSVVSFSSSETNCKGMCSADLCSRVSCPPPEECASGHIAKSGSPCDCCGTCVIYLNENEPCDDEEASEIRSPRRRCKIGLSCQERSCQFNDSVPSCLKVVQHRQKALSYTEDGKHVFSRDLWTPKCDGRGYFDAKQCKKKKCFCVDEDGNRIFGQQERDLAQNMTCGCSRNMWALQKENPDLWMTRPQPHCSQDGNYDILQCLNDLCYCADPITGDVEGRVVKMTFMDILSCYDPKKHDKLYKTQCEKQLMRARSLVYWFKQKGMHIEGLEDVQCDVDGSFAPRQCQTDRCVCTDRSGVSIKSYGVETKKTEYVKNMTCRCGRDEHDREIFHARYPRMVCDGIGNYEPHQCFDGKCYCVDEDGDVIVDIPPELDDNANLYYYCYRRRYQVEDARAKFGTLDPYDSTTTDPIDYTDEYTY